MSVILSFFFKNKSFLSLQTLPIFLDKLVPPWAAILISVTLILMFGEVVHHQLKMWIFWFLMYFACTNYYSLFFSYTYISLQILPQAVCTRYGLRVGATMAPLVRLLLLLFFPLSYPISKVEWIEICNEIYVCKLCFVQVGLVIWFSAVENGICDFFCTFLLI